MTKRSGPSLITPADELAQVIGPDLAQHFIDHRKALRKPMTTYAAQLMANKLRGFPDPVAAVQQSILKGWQDVFPVAPTAEPRLQGIDALEQDLRRRVDEHRNGRGSGEPGPRAHSAEAFPALSVNGRQGHSRSH